MTSYDSNQLHEEPGHVSIQELEGWKSGLSTFVLGFAGLASGGLTFGGLKLVTKTSIAALLALVSVVMAFACWRYLTHYYPRSRGHVRDGLALRVAVPTAVLVVLTSTVTGFAGLATPAAMQHSLVERVDRAETVLQEAEKRALDEAALLPILEAQAAEWNAMAEDESERGRFYLRGKGSIHGGLQGIARAFSAGHQTVKDSERAHRDAARRAGQTIAAMRQVIDDAARTDEGMREASRVMAGHLRRFNVAISELEQSPINGVLVGLETAKEQQANATLTAKRKKRRTRERAAKEAISTMANEALANVREALGEAQQPSQSTEPLRVPLPMESLSEQFQRVAPLLGYVVAIDLFLPLFVLMAMTHLQTHLVRATPATPIRKASTDEAPRTPVSEGPARLALIAEGLRRHRNGS